MAEHPDWACENHPRGEDVRASRFVNGRKYCAPCFDFLFGKESEHWDNAPTVKVLPAVSDQVRAR